MPTTFFGLVADFLVVMRYKLGEDHAAACQEAIPLLAVVSCFSIWLATRQGRHDLRRRTYRRFVRCLNHSRWTGGRSLGRSGGCRRLDAQVAVQFGLGNPLVAETGQRPQMTALDQVEDRFIVHAQ